MPLFSLHPAEHTKQFMLVRVFILDLPCDGGQPPSQGRFPRRDLPSEKIVRFAVQWFTGLMAFKGFSKWGRPTKWCIHCKKNSVISLDESDDFREWVAHHCMDQSRTRIKEFRKGNACAFGDRGYINSDDAGGFHCNLQWLREHNALEHSTRVVGFQCGVGAGKIETPFHLRLHKHTE